MNPDEGFYALAAKEAMSGAIPYRDFGYSQAPLLPYLNGALMKWIGFGWLEQRWVNALWGLATLVLLAYGGARVGQPWLGLLGITTLILSPFWIHYTCMGKTYAASGFWLSLSTLAAVLPGQSKIRIWVFSISAAIALGCRLTVLPGVWFMVIALAAKFTGIRKKIILGGSFGACLIVVFLPFYLMGPENFLFWNIQYHLGSTFDRRQWSNILEYITLAPGIWFIMLVPSCLTIGAFKHVRFMEWGFLLAAWVGVLWNLFLKSNYGENATPFVAVGLLGAMALSN